MNKIEQLIEELCPQGVEFKALGDLEDAEILKLGRGKVISKTDLAASPGDYPVYSSSAVGSGEFGRYGEYMFEDERISWSIDGGGRFFYRSEQKYSVTNVSGWLKMLDSEMLNTKYLYYFLTDAWATKVFDYTKKAHPSIIRDEYTIPIPPLAIQKEIVKILDNFTRLEAELEAELEARKKQYEYYREALLTFGDDVEWMSLKELMKRNKGTKITASQMKELHRENAPVKIFAGGKTFAMINFEDIPKKDIHEIPSIIVKSRGVIEFEYYDKPFSHKNEFWSYFSENDKINTKYVFYFLKIKEPYFQTIASRMQMPQISLPDTENYQIPIPPLPKQKEIVAILDKFDALVNDISTGLPAEITARKKQYEYYRNQLLTFKPLELQDAN